MKVTLRRREKLEVKFKYKLTENFPVDLYYLMDLSYSMASYREALSRLGNKLSQTMTNLTKNFRLGFGSYDEKIEFPFDIS